MESWLVRRAVVGFAWKADADADKTARAATQDNFILQPINSTKYYGLPMSTIVEAKKLTQGPSEKLEQATWLWDVIGCCDLLFSARRREEALGASFVWWKHAPTTNLLDVGLKQDIEKTLIARVREIGKESILVRTKLPCSLLNGVVVLGTPVTVSRESISPRLQ